MFLPPTLLKATLASSPQTSTVKYSTSTRYISLILEANEAWNISIWLASLAHAYRQKSGAVLI
jgi:hypothetical protein